ncbi:MAG: cupin domain-containing protein [Desulfuromonadales bacterium]|nr:cupin domain-containing protein [Desulfuromonadales bacterium]NIR33147.1 cupin domain-containing protein [Desulfuromonadales bacterium]NIS41931.1 cupin domain-containing protein [Desulfuromonadales bacterium]
MATDKRNVNVNGGESLDLENLVQYQDGSIVSRTLLEDQSGTLTVFSFDQGQALSEHTVPFNAFVQVLDGEAEIGIGGTPVTVKTGEIVLMPGGIPHRVRAPKRFKMLLTMFKTAVA